MRVLVDMVLSGIPTDDDRRARHDELDPHMEQLALMMVPVALLDHHLTAGDAVEELLELLDAPRDLGFQGRRSRHVAERDLRRNLHGSLEVRMVPEAIRQGRSLLDFDQAVDRPYG